MQRQAARVGGLVHKAEAISRGYSYRQHPSPTAREGSPAIITHVQGNEVHAMDNKTYSNLILPMEDGLNLEPGGELQWVEAMGRYKSIEITDMSESGAIPLHAWLIMGVALFAVSSAGAVFEMIEDVGGLSKAAWRLQATSLVLLPGDGAIC